MINANFDELKRHHINIQTAYDSLAARYLELQSEKSAIESQHEDQVERWRHELESKHSQFEEARAQIMKPRELEKLRKQLIEEIERPTREKLLSYEQELDESAEKYSQAVRDLEILRTQHEIEVARLLKENEYRKIDHAQEITMIRKELEMSDETVAAKVQQIDALQAEICEQLQLKANNTALEAEIESERELHQKAVVVAETAEKQLKHHIHIAEKLERRIVGLQAEVEERKMDYSRLTIKVDQAETSKAELQNRIDELQFKHRSEIKRLQAEAAKERVELEAELAIEREEADEKEQGILMRLAAHDATIKKVQDDCDTKVSAAEDSSREARRRAEAGKIEAEMKLDAALTELAACKSDALKAVGEAGGLRAALAVMEREYAHEVPGLRKDLEQYKKVSPWKLCLIIHLFSDQDSSVPCD